MIATLPANRTGVSFSRRQRTVGPTQLCRSASLFSILLLVITSEACGHSQGQSQDTEPGVAAQGSVTGATFDFSPNDPPGELRSQAHDYANTRYSTLDQINIGNASKLRIAWTFSDGTQGGHEAAPLIVAGTMYVVTPFPDILFALDLTKPGHPIKWEFKPNPSPTAKGKACGDSVNRGVAFVDGKLIYNLLDDRWR